ncbi:MAG: GTP-binding protein, partial [Phycisphaerae bacterium]
MELPLVVIVGRPNVGKSSLLNMLAREQISIVDPRAGITRDRVTALIENERGWFELIDTGGIGMVDDQQLDAHVHQQIDFAIERANVVLFVVDVLQGLTPLDNEIAQRLRKLNLPVILLANKADHHTHEYDAADLERMGFGPAQPVSALHSYGRDAIFEQIFAHLPDAPTEAPELPAMKLAIVGKRNAGKSTLVNALA